MTPLERYCWEAVTMPRYRTKTKVLTFPLSHALGRYARPRREQLGRHTNAKSQSGTIDAGRRRMLRLGASICRRGTISGGAARRRAEQGTHQGSSSAEI
jgi:hypothetical protein